MVILYYNPDFKYTNRKIITITQKDNEMRTEINVAHLDTPDTINGHIIYNLKYLIPLYQVQPNHTELLPVLSFCPNSLNYNHLH